MGRSRVDADDDSEKGILPDLERDGITKTVVHEIVSEERGDRVQMPTRTYSNYGKIES
jgi:hypothetical protein